MIPGATRFNECYSGPLERQVFGVALAQQSAKAHTECFCDLRLAQSHCIAPIQHAAYSFMAPQIVVNCRCSRAPGRTHRGFRGRYYAASCVRTSENSPTTHSGE